MTKILLVDEQDKPIGYGDKLAVHVAGLRHRAFSVFIVNSAGQCLLQKRAAGKYHSGGLWSNACCGHFETPKVSIRAVRRRLAEEMGLDCDLWPAGIVAYRVPVGQGLVEDEINHIFIGLSDQEPRPDPQEAAAYRYLSPAELRRDLSLNPDRYSEWLKIILARIDF